MPEKTEEPTQKRLDDARKEGNVARSKEFSDAVIMLSVVGYFLFNGRSLFNSLMNLFKIAGSCLSYSTEIDCVRYVGLRLVREFATQIMPFFVIVLIVPIVTEIGQVGFIFTSERIKPSLKKFDVVTNIKNIFSKKTLVNLIKMLLIVTVCPCIIWLVIKSGFRDIFGVVSLGLPAIFLNGVNLLLRECSFLLLFFFILAVLDFIWEKYSKHKELKMTREEVRREIKDDQGSPEVRSRRRELHQELMAGVDSGVESDVAGASAIVTNPAHLAVAIFYDKQKTLLPIVVAKGQHERARRIVEIAEKHNVPIIRNVPLARGLIRYARIRRFIPFEFLEPVAEVLRTVRDMRMTEKLRESGQIDMDEDW